MKTNRANHSVLLTYVCSLQIKDFVTVICCYLCRRLASGEGIVTLDVCVCVCLCVHRAATARRVSFGGEGNALYPLQCSLVMIVYYFCSFCNYFF